MRNVLAASLLIINSIGCSTLQGWCEASDQDVRWFYYDAKLDVLRRGKETQKPQDGIFCVSPEEYEKARTYELLGRQGCAIGNMDQGK